MAAKNAKTPKTEGAASAADTNFVEFVGRAFKLPDGLVVGRLLVDWDNTSLSGEVVFVPEARADKFAESGWVKLVGEPALDCTVRELQRLDLGHAITLS